MPKPYYPGYKLGWTMNWSEGSTDPNNPTVIPQSAANWAEWDSSFRDVPSPLSVLAPDGPPPRKPSLMFIATVNFGATAPTPPPVLAFAVSSVKKGNGVSGQGPNAFTGPNPVTWTVPAFNAVGGVVEYDSPNVTVNNKGNFEISVLISAYNAANQAVYWRIDPEMDVDTSDGGGSK